MLQRRNAIVDARLFRVVAIHFDPSYTTWQTTMKADTLAAITADLKELVNSKGWPDPHPAPGGQFDWQPGGCPNAVMRFTDGGEYLARTRAYRPSPSACSRTLRTSMCPWTFPLPTSGRHRNVAIKEMAATTRFGREARVELRRERRVAGRAAPGW